MKLSPLILSMAVAGASADRLGASPRTSRAASADRTAMTHRHLKEEEVGNDGVGQCGQCKKADDCLPNYECVSATESGCFNFDVSGMAETYCVPGPTDAPTVPVTDAPTVTPAPTAATTTLAPTDADVMEPTAAPTVAGTTSSPTVIIPANGGSVPTCGQCEDTSDCAEGHLCVTASASGCFNFDVSGNDNMHCAPVFTPSDGTEATTSAPSAAATTVEPTSAPSEAATTVEPTSAPSEAASTTSPTVTATTTAPTVASTGTSGPTVAGTATTPEPTVGTIRFVGGDPDILMRVCEGDCDDGKSEIYMYLFIIHV